MENISLLYNGNSSDVSSSNSSILGEFPYWQPTLAVSLLFNVIVPSDTVLVLYLPLLVVLLRIMRKDHFKPLNMVHASLLIASILDDILRTSLYSIYLPSALRYCVCSDLINAMLSAEYRFFYIYRPLSFACLSVLHLFVILGKKKFINLKVACSMIAVCISVSFVCAASVARLFYGTDRRLICHTSHCPRSEPETILVNPAVILLFFTLVAVFPSLVVVVITSTWSCAVFKKYYTGGDDQLNRRILSLPFIMPLVIIASSVFEAVLGGSVARVISMLSPGELFPYWIVFINSILFSILRFLIRLPYLIILLYTHTPLRQAVKRLLDQLKNKNRVTPGSVNSDTASSSYVIRGPVLN